MALPQVRPPAGRAALVAEWRKWATVSSSAHAEPPLTPSPPRRVAKPVALAPSLAAFVPHPPLELRPRKKRRRRQRTESPPAHGSDVLPPIDQSGRAVSPKKAVMDAARCACKQRKRRHRAEMRRKRMEERAELKRRADLEDLWLPLNTAAYHYADYLRQLKV
eukprot:TRINITY_DN34692_c0_g1_i1.p2 TRINITY_DN34692_c0_g1~~TRINITY_DN34692_c0_g1_i1.p2  ORF type:complete len:163 (+),score=36.59 TRINITY_DN34692_c0_g1_i1:46-534(+)